MIVSAAHEFLPKVRTVRATAVMDQFGIGLEQGRHVIAERLVLPLTAGQVVLFSGASGSGKSSLMRATASELTLEGHGVVSLDAIDLPSRLLIDAFPGALSAVMPLLAQCGLGEARLLLRRPEELSDGQRYRLRLALALAMQPAWVVADEFTATLDRTLARVIAFNLRRMADRGGPGFLLATTHDDVAEDLDPDVHVCCRLEGETEVHTRKSTATVSSASGSAERDETTRRKKKESRSSPNCGSPRRPDATGRISLGGITGPITSA